MSRARFIAATCLICLAGCAAPELATKPGAYTVSKQPVEIAGRKFHLTYVRPEKLQHPGYLLVFATGDAGWWGASHEMFEHLAEEGYDIAGFNAPEIIKPIERSGERIGIAEAAKGLAEAYARAKRDLGLAESTPIIVVGFSRGATMVAFTALHPELRGGVAGAVAIALTREADYLRAQPAERAAGIQVDDKDRIQIYPALKYLGSTPLAVIQSTNDPYVPAAESRQLLGPDTPTLRLYPVEARNHGFSNARDKLLADLDDALRWIEQPSTSRASTHSQASPRS
ncbi:MAG TPA: AcvB/VirJ family lysyl-phosphatidylglycerol hydrolase [Steroidobacteraceae bacterium]|jgi:dienelactone hydrolase|nr:AcvB/VirJ family lysyl-phosphatidylglycerol hydrolase [Steroidobacteraceae bacterium]